MRERVYVLNCLRIVYRAVYFELVSKTINCVEVESITKIKIDIHEIID